MKRSNIGFTKRTFGCSQGIFCALGDVFLASARLRMLADIFRALAKICVPNIIFHASADFRALGGVLVPIVSYFFYRHYDLA